MNPISSSFQPNFMNPRDSMNQSGIKANMINSGSFGSSMNNQNASNQSPRPTGFGLNSTQQDAYIKDSGAPVNFDPNSMQNISGMFGSSIPNSFDRSMNSFNDVQLLEDQPTY